ncbi:MAG: hypothetical protein A4E55_01284 [Pelotomaculum sp. PtaU1.Bin035]|nr:MAG: hypothetical protein A4E55_01284 [Pelotomaculum sp. PtaU1.Bin035]
MPVSAAGQFGPDPDLPPALLRILSLAGESGVALRAGAECILKTLLAGRINGRAPDRAWSSSTLTTTGFPVEIGWSSTAGELRYTVEPGGPDTAPQRRLALAAELLARLKHPVDQQALQALGHFQENGPLRYGAWVGVRHRGAATSFKLYSEVSSSRRFLENYLPPGGEGITRWPLTSCRLDLVGLETGTGRLEFYYKTAGLSPRGLKEVMRPLGLESQTDVLIHAIEALHGRPAYKRLPGNRQGFSYCLPASGKPLFTFCLFAADLFSSDAEIRRRLLALGREKHWDTGFYDSITAPLEHSGHRTTHGMFGITQGESGEPACNVGFPPPPDRG